MKWEVFFICSHRYSIKGRVYPAILPVENKRVNGRVSSSFILIFACPAIKLCLIMTNSLILYGSIWFYDSWNLNNQSNCASYFLFMFLSEEPPLNRTEVAIFLLFCVRVKGFWSRENLYFESWETFFTFFQCELVVMNVSILMVIDGSLSLWGI